MRDLVDVIAAVCGMGWKLLCLGGVLGLGLVMCDRRDRPRVPRPVRQVEPRRMRRAA